jgi:hypothetical protein
MILFISNEIFTTQFILWSRFKIDAFNDLYYFILFNFLKDVSILILYTQLNILTLNKK